MTMMDYNEGRTWNFKALVLPRRAVGLRLRGLRLPSASCVSSLPAACTMFGIYM